MKLDCIDRLLTRLFFKLGVCIARYPYYFLIVPFALSAFLLTGMQRVRYEDDPEYLFSPTGGQGKIERNVLESNFPVNFSGAFNPGRLVRAGKFGRVIVTPKNGSSVLTKEMFETLFRLDKIVREITIRYDEETFGFEDLCATWQGQCFQNDVLDLRFYPWNSRGGGYNMSFPVETHIDSFKKLYLPGMFGGIKVIDDKMVDAGAVQMNWFLKAGSPKEHRQGSLWEAEFLKKMEEVNLPAGKVCRFVSDTIESELESNSFGIVPYFVVSVFAMLVFTFLALSMSDSVRSKPSLGCFGVFSAMLATGAAFGLLSYAGLEFISINMAAPFLMLGIGMDDTFVMLASWRKTKPQDSIEDRMGEMLSDAAVSITITSLTDMLSFWIGVATPFPCVRIFCIYTALSVLFTYAYHITFFAACMAITGKLEAKNRHGFLLCITATPKSLAEDRGCCYRLCCTGGVNADDPYNDKDNQDHLLMRFFRDGIGKFLSLVPMKIFVLCIFIAYLAIALWSCTKLQEGLQLRKLSVDGSYSIDFYDVEDRYFREYSYRLQIVIDQTLNYSDANVRNGVEDLLQTFENSQYVANKSMTESWLREYEKAQEIYYLQESNPGNEKDYIRQLREMFLDGPMGAYYKSDVKFADNFTSISSCRFVVQTYGIWNTKIESEMLTEMRGIAESSKFNVVTYHQYFIFMDQYLLVRKVTIQAVVIAAVVMTVISLIFIPSPLCALWVGFSIVSIEIGVIGYMALWGVHLDGISMINLIMCIGFSVDFSAHVSYAYISSKETEANARMKDALYALGLPIVQGAMSTFLSVAFLCFSPSYIFITFFKTVFLVIFFGAMHGLFLLPVMLSLIGPGTCSRKKSKQKTKPILVSIIDGKNMTIPRPKTTSSMESSPKGSDKDSHQDLERDPGLGTSAEEGSDVSNDKGSDNNSETKADPVYSVVGNSNRDFPPAFQHIFDNRAYSSDEDEVVFSPRGGQRRSVPVTGAENRNVDVSSVGRAASGNKRRSRRKS